jgi:DNA-binding XRE family transcriptional regulator
MESTEQFTTTPAQSVPALVIDIGGTDYTVHPSDGPVVIGRSFPAQVVINHAWISRTHVRLEPSEEGWTAVDTSRNGTFVDGERHSVVPITGEITLRLGNPDGFPVQLRLTDAEVPDDFDDEDDDFEVTDPGVLRAGLAVARRREELDLSQRWLARHKIVNGGTLVKLEKGRRFPRPRTLAKLEDALQWPRGTIERLRDGEDPPVAPVPADDERTAVVTGGTAATASTASTGSTVQATLMAEAAQLALAGFTTAIENLPAPTEPDFSTRANPTLADLRRLEAVASNAARTAKGAPEVVVTLSAVRKAYTDLMLTAARAPTATLGQRLFAARHHAELTRDEAASAAGVHVDVVAAAESENPLPANAISALEGLIHALDRR